MGIREVGTEIGIFYVLNSSTGEVEHSLQVEDKYITVYSSLIIETQSFIYFISRVSSDYLCRIDKNDYKTNTINVKTFLEDDIGDTIASLFKGGGDRYLIIMMCLTI